MSLNDRIREARKDKGLTQEQLGNIIGVAKTTIAGYEKNREPTAANVGAIADALGVDVNYLFQDEMKNPPAPAEAETGGLKPDDRALLDDYHKLNENGREAARNAVHGLTYAPNYQRLKESQNVEVSEIASDAIRTIDKLTEATRKNQNDSLRKK